MRPVIPASEFDARVKKTQESMREQGIDILLAYGNEAEPQFQRYYSDYWPSFESAGVMFAAEGDPVLLIGPESMTFAKDRSRIRDIRRLAAFRESSNPEYPGHVLQTFADVIEDLVRGGEPKRLAIAGYNLVPHYLFEELRESLKRFNNIEIVRGDELVMKQRMIKSPAEIECMRYAGRITAQTMDYVIEHIKPGMTELEVRGLALGRMHELGAENEAYSTWVLAGQGGNQAISRARHKVIGKNELVHLQFGARYEGYASTIGRPVIIGKPEKWMTDAITAGYEGYEAILEQLVAGNNAGNVARAFYETMDKNGYADWLLYGPCHGTGLMEGEPPWIEQGSNYIMQENMTYCICLFMGNKDGYGFRIEDSIRVAPEKAENMTNYRRDIIIIS
ncbi:MAG: aminopeptidase P family protein [Christensenellaceae bacterium]|nr:aminopeptidase P family protein [Christensenellaceae bacterium]